MNVDNGNEPDTEVTIGGALGPHAMAAALVKRPAMFIGFPPTRERAIAFIHGFDMALSSTGSSTSLRQEHWELLKPLSEGGQATAEQELAHIRALLPVFEDLFAAAAEIKRERANEDREIAHLVRKRSSAGEAVPLADIASSLGLDADDYR